jgi:hypothetical protein
VFYVYFFFFLLSFTHLNIKISTNNRTNLMMINCFYHGHTVIISRWWGSVRYSSRATGSTILKTQIVSSAHVNLNLNWMTWPPLLGSCDSHFYIPRAWRRRNHYRCLMRPWSKQNSILVTNHWAMATSPYSYTLKLSHETSGSPTCSFPATQPTHYIYRASATFVVKEKKWRISRSL